MELRYLYRSVISWLDTKKHLQEFEDDMVIADIQRLLIGHALEPGSGEDRIFWANVERDHSLQFQHTA
jgi:hypothetical protein